MITTTLLWLYCIYAYFTKKVNGLNDLWLERILILGIIEASLELICYHYLR